MEIIKYNQNIKDRARDLRKAKVLSEVLLWNEIKGKKVLGYRFLRQKPIGNYIVDFYCPEIKLAIEIDGSSHDSKIEEDIFRQKQLESFGIIFIRFTDQEVRKNMESVLGALLDKIKNTLFNKEENTPRLSQSLELLPSRGEPPSFK